MSWQAVAAVIDLPHDLISYGPYRVLLKLANVADENGRGGFQFDPKLAAELGVSVRSIIRWRAELEQQQLVRRGDQKRVGYWRGGNRPIVYDVNMHAAPDVTPLVVTDELLDFDFAGQFSVDPVAAQCPMNAGGPHAPDPLSGYCPCGIRI